MEKKLIEQFKQNVRRYSVKKKSGKEKQRKKKTGGMIRRKITKW